MQRAVSVSCVKGTEVWCNRKTIRLRTKFTRFSSGEGIGEVEIIHLSVCKFAIGNHFLQVRAVDDLCHSSK